MTAGLPVPPGDDGADLAAGYIARWRPSSLSPRAAAFARDVIAQVAPEEKERAKNLLWAAGKLADFGIGLGLDAVPEVPGCRRCAVGCLGCTVPLRWKLPGAHVEGEVEGGAGVGEGADGQVVHAGAGHLPGVLQP